MPEDYLCDGNDVHFRDLPAATAGRSGIAVGRNTANSSAGEHQQEPAVLKGSASSDARQNEQCSE